MKFVNTYLLIYIISAGLFIYALMIWQNRKYFNWIKTYWFLERSKLNRVSTFIYYLSLLLLLLSLLDLRGPEVKVKGALPDQRTIILIDASLSMLCEDVRPNRFQKAVQLARHFVKNSAGHQLSIVLFSDTQKRIIPFTDDIDLIDSRLAALENINSVGGGSNISQAVSEAAGYFESDSDSGSKDTNGNILLFTDAEESDGDFKINLSSNINLGVVGIGTAKGGNIPLRWEDGSFKGYKQVKNDPVTTKLNENYISSLGKNIKNYSYWIVNSYSLPTESIQNFFRATYNKAHNNGDMRVRPVYSHLILIPGILLYCISVLLGRFLTFKTLTSLVIVLLGSSVFQLTYAQDEKAEKPKISDELISDLNKMKTGKSTRVEILKTAEKLLKEKQDKQAADLYSEYLKRVDEEPAQFNYATSMLKQGQFEKAMPFVNELLKSSKDEQLKNKLRSNLLTAIKAKKNHSKNNDDKKNEDKKEDKNEEKNEEKKDDKKEEDQKEKQDKNKEENKDKKNDKGKQDKKGEQKEDQKGKDGKDSKESSKNQQQKKSEEEKKEEEQKKENEDKGQETEEEKNAPKSLSEKEKMIEQKRKMAKIPGMVKQIMNDDRELQKKLMDTSTKEKGELKPKNDW